MILSFELWWSHEFQPRHLSFCHKCIWRILRIYRSQIAGEKISTKKKINFKKFECFCTRIITVWCERKVVPKGGGRKYINTLLRVMKNISRKCHRGARTMIICLVIFCRRTIKTWKSWPSFLSFKSCPSLLSIPINDRKQFQRLNEVLSNRTAHFVLGIQW